MPQIKSIKARELAAGLTGYYAHGEGLTLSVECWALPAEVCSTAKDSEYTVSEGGRLNYR